MNRLSTRSKIWRHSSISEQWLNEALKDRVVNAQTPRLHAKIALPNGQPAMLKLMAASRHRFEPWSSINILPRLKPRFADNEGNAYRHFSAAGLATPQLYAYGEDWHFGLRGQGFVLVEWMDHPLLQTQLEQAPNSGSNELTKETCFAWAAYLSAVHHSGYVHGDADSDNFLLMANNNIIAIDLEKSQPLNKKNQLKEINRATRCLAEHGVNQELIGATVDHYHICLSNQAER